MNNEQQKTLTKAITQLPVYAPPETSWDDIQRALVLQEGVQQLPQHEPPSIIWDNIRQELPTARPKLVWLNKWAVAASILLVISVGWWVFETYNNKVQLNYSTETVDIRMLVTDWDEDDALISELAAICEVERQLCSQPTFQNLEQELQTLEIAKAELKMAIDQFGKDTELIAQLGEIELARTAILKQMMETVL